MNRRTLLKAALAGPSAAVMAFFGKNVLRASERRMKINKTTCGKMTEDCTVHLDSVKLKSRSGTEYICDLPNGVDNVRLYVDRVSQIDGDSVFVSCTKDGWRRSYLVDMNEKKLKHAEFDKDSGEMIWTDV